jgi:hypothetical protein
MNTPQVSIWVPVVVGLIGLVGIVIGQLTNAWLENRRWKREKAREDLRWQRDIQKDEAARASADRSHWRDKKFEIYNELLSFMKSWRDLNDDAAKQHRLLGSLTDVNKEACEKIILASREYRDKVELIATDREAKKVLFDAIKIYLLWSDLMSKDRAPISTFGATVDSFVDANSEVIDVLLAAIRVDLGIGDKDDRDYLPKIKKLSLRD